MRKHIETIPVIEQLTQRPDVFNIGWEKQTEEEGLLSNFAPTPFVLDGMNYANAEAFWQCLKFDESDAQRALVAQMSAVEAKKAGRKRDKSILRALSGVLDSRTFWYRGGEIVYGSAEHHALMRRALHAKYSQNEDARHALLSTEGKLITHFLISPDKRTISYSSSFPNRVFAQMLMELRAEFLAQ